MADEQTTRTIAYAVLILLFVGMAWFIARRAGDRIDVYGLEASPGVVHIEKMRISYAAPLKVRPKCTACNRTMKAMGTNQGVRCPECKAKQSKPWTEIEREVALNVWVQPPIDARRHLARALELDLHHSS